MNAGTTRNAVALVALAALALLMAACGSSPASGGQTGHQSTVAFSRCMRSHQVSSYPDPNSSGALPKTSPQQLGVSTAVFNAAVRTCQHLLPSDTAALESCEQNGACSAVDTQRLLNDGRRFARCMRSHGVNWPDPTVDAEGRPAFAISISRDGFDPHAQQVVNKVNECDHLMPGGGVPIAVSS